MDAIQTVQREVLGWSTVQYSFALDDKKKTLLEDLLNALHLTSEFTRDLSNTLENREYWTKTNGENTTLEDVSEEEEDSFVIVGKVQGTGSVVDVDHNEDDEEPAQKQRCIEGRLDNSLVEFFKNSQDKATDLERFKYVCSWLDAVSRLMEEDLRARTVQEAEGISDRLKDVMDGEKTQKMKECLRI